MLRFLLIATATISIGISFADSVDTKNIDTEQKIIVIE
jgi:hypothetical protein